MMAVSFARRSSYLSLNLLLRRNSINKFVLVFKILFISAMIAALLFAVNEVVSTVLTSPLPSLPTAILHPAEVENTEKKAELRDYSIIAKRNIFGASDIKPTPKPEVNVAKIPYTLIGTFVSPGSTSSAILENSKNQEQDVFGVNEAVFGEGRIVAIKPDSIDLEWGGSVQTLKLSDLESSSDTTEFKEGVATIGSNEYLVEERELDKALENLPLLLTQARAVPYFKDGQSVGLRLFAIRSDSLFSKIGLMNGDILKSINGSSLGDLTQAIKLFERLKQERSINLVLERNREEKNFKYQIK